jgi:eukaryotic-like serine/threonine-protein kinase
MLEMDTVRGGRFERGALLRRFRSPHVFGGRYKIEGLLAQGGMGDVYLALDEHERRYVALKLLRASGVDLRRARARFAQEAATATLLRHFRIVHTLDFGCESDGTLYLVMELLEGETLGSRLRDGRVLSARESVLVAIQVLEALEAAHESGILHRDLKPENVFLVAGESSVSVKILDFGVAKSLHNSPSLSSLETTAGTVFGTPRYMSPEQARGGPLDVRSDVYGVGVLLYQMLAGHLPFEDEDAVVVMARHIRDEPPPLDRHASERRIPRSLLHVTHRALEKDPEDRFDSATAFRRALLATLPSVDRLRHPVMNWLLNPGPVHKKARRWTSTGLTAALLVLAGLSCDLSALKPRYGMPRGDAEPRTTVVGDPNVHAPLSEARRP